MHQNALTSSKFLLRVEYGNRYTVSHAYVISLSLTSDTTTFDILGDVPKHSEFNSQFLQSNCPLLTSLMEYCSEFEDLTFIFGKKAESYSRYFCKAFCSVLVLYASSSEFYSTNSLIQYI